MVHCIYPGVTNYNFPNVAVFIFLKIVFVLASMAEPDEMPHYGTFHLCLQCLPKYVFRSHCIQWVKAFKNIFVIGTKKSLSISNSIIKGKF